MVRGRRGLYGEHSSGGERAEAAAVKDQRGGRGIDVDSVYAQQDHLVVARADPLFDGAVEPGARACEKNRALLGPAPRHPADPVDTASGQAPGRGLLRSAQNTDTKPL